MVGRALSLVLLRLLTSAAEASEVKYATFRSDGAPLSEGSTDAGRILVPRGGAIRFSCDACAFVVLDVNGAFASELTCTEAKPTCGHIEPGKTVLPIALVSGPSTPIEKAGAVVLKFGPPDDPAQGRQGAKTAEAVVVDFGTDEPWWQVTDTFAYAVTRDSGNTAIAGAGVFVDLPNWLLPWRKLREQLRYSVVVHLLPPLGGDSPADLGIAPIGFGLFGNRVVFGVGWNMSRRGTRPTAHNQYFYVGFSASQVLRAGK